MQINLSPFFGIILNQEGFFRGGKVIDFIL